MQARASTVDMSSRVDPVITIPRIPYEELQKSTNNWNPVNILGKGGFGTVFKGMRTGLSGLNDALFLYLIV